MAWSGVCLWFLGKPSLRASSCCHFYLQFSLILWMWSLLRVFQTLREGNFLPYSTLFSLWIFRQTFLKMNHNDTKSITHVAQSEKNKTKWWLNVRLRIRTTGKAVVYSPVSGWRLEASWFWSRQSKVATKPVKSKYRCWNVQLCWGWASKESLQMRSDQEIKKS